MVVRCGDGVFSLGFAGGNDRRRARDALGHDDGYRTVPDSCDGVAGGPFDCFPAQTDLPMSGRGDDCRYPREAGAVVREQLACFEDDGGQRPKRQLAVLDRLGCAADEVMDGCAIAARWEQDGNGTIVSVFRSGGVDSDEVLPRCATTRSG